MDSHHRQLATLISPAYNAAISSNKTFRGFGMASERMQRRLERLLDQIDEVEANGNWESVRDLALDVLAIDSENADATVYLEAAERRVSRSAYAAQQPPPPLAPTAQTNQPTSFANGRYEV